MRDLDCGWDSIRVAAIVVGPAVAEIDVQSLATRTRDQLSAYKVPTRWVLAVSEQIPTLASGKLNRKALRTLVVDGTLPTTPATR